MILKDHEDEDPKYQRVKELLFDERWIDRGCIIFSQYYDSIHWLAERLKDEIGDEPIGIYAGGSKSKIMNRAYSGGQTEKRSSLSSRKVIFDYYSAPILQARD